MKNIYHNNIISYSTAKIDKATKIYTTDSAHKLYDKDDKVNAVAMYQMANTLYNRANIYLDFFKNTWNKCKYLQEYNTYLLGLYTDEEFFKVAESFVQEYAEFSEDEIRKRVILLINDLNEDLASTEISDIINAKHEDIEEAMRTVCKTHGISS